MEEDGSSDTANGDSSIIVGQSDDSDEQIVVSKAPRKSGKKKVKFANDGNEAEDEKRTPQKPAPTPSPRNAKDGASATRSDEPTNWFQIGCAVLLLIFAVSIDHFFRHMQHCQSEKSNGKVTPDLPPPSETLLKRYKAIYGPYGITRPDELPKYTSIKKLREQISRDKPFLKYYQCLSHYWVSWSEKLENDWDRRFTENSYDDQLSEDERERNTFHSTMLSIKIDGVMDGNSAIHAFVKARTLLHNDKKMTVDGLRKVQGIFESETPEKEVSLGEYRTTQNWIKRGNKKAAMAHVFELPSAAEKMVNYYNEKCLPLPERSLKYACCVLHWYQKYEMIQMFDHGNGIVGRIWVNAMLEYKGLPPMQMGGFPRDPEEYYELWEKGGKFWEDHLTGIMGNIAEPQVQVEENTSCKIETENDDDDRLEEEEL